MVYLSPVRCSESLTIHTRHVIGYGMKALRAKKFSVTIMAVLLAVIAYKKAVYRLDDKLEQVKSPQHTQRGTSDPIASRSHFYSLVKGTPVFIALS